MKSINRSDFSLVGSVAKTHATKGELKLIFDTPVKLKEWVFLEIREKPVPFFIEEVRQTYNDEAIVKLNGINNIEEATTLTGFKLLYPTKLLKIKKLPADIDLVGFLITDKNQGDIGILEEIIELPKQTLLKTTYQNKEVLIPAVEPLLTDIKVNKKVILVNLPEGFLEIN